ncbi:MAG: ABC transporter permease subunit [Bdellovibrionales bacterium]|nr:ABC transporter permease subunit [Bdellovibrionales bacterium]
MFQYLLRRLVMMIPTTFGITLVVFVIINLAPGSPIEQKLQAMRFGGGGDGSADVSSGGANQSQGVSQEVIDALNKQYGFDKPLHVRYGIWLKNLATLNFGESFTHEEPVTDVILSKFPVSVQFGVASFFLTYLICVPLGIAMAWKETKTFDSVASFVLFVLYAVPPFMLAILLLVFLGGGSFLDLFPLGYLKSDNYDELGTFAKIWDRVHHFILPLTCYMIGHFTTLTLLMRNSVLDEIRKDYVRTARAKGLDEKAVYLKHALRNALIPIATGIGGFLSVFFAGSLLLEQIFSLDGMGLLFDKATLDRDYNVLMGLIFFQSILMLVGNLISDFIYVAVDPRIDFS